MKVYSFNFSDVKGGAAIAANRIHISLRTLGVDSKMIVYRKFSNQEFIVGPSNIFFRVFRMIRSKMGSLITSAFKRNSNVFNSASIFPSNWANKINKSDIDLVHLHWINLDFMSIEDISKIKKPIIWTIHDMWAFCSTEHLAWDEKYIYGYSSDRKWRGFDINEWVWHRKIKFWTKPMHIVAPSTWLASCARKSKLMHDWPISVIHNPIDTRSWHLYDQEKSRRILNLPLEKKLIVFSTSENLFSFHKGFDLLLESLSKLHKEGLIFILLVIGTNPPPLRLPYDFDITYYGYVNDSVELNHLICASDLVTVPSRQESLSYVAIETITCGRPVVAFNNSGLKDVIVHNHSGYLANPFDVNDYANGIKFIIENPEIAFSMGKNGRLFAEKMFDSNIIAEKYKKLYQSIL